MIPPNVLQPPWHQTMVAPGHNNGKHIPPKNEPVKTEQARLDRVLVAQKKVRSRDWLYLLDRYVIAERAGGSIRGELNDLLV